MAHQELVKDPLVLRIVFRYLSVPDLKSVRSVCKDWERPASVHLSKRTDISLCEIPDDYATKPKPAEGSTLLVQNVKLRDAPCEAQDQKEAYKENCITFLKMNNETIEEISFELCAILGCIMKPTFEECEFPNLKKITVLAVEHFNRFKLSGAYFPKDVAEELSPNKLIRPMTEVTCLEIIFDDGKYGQETPNSPSLITFQRLVDKCPSLKKIKINGNIYFDLKSCSGRLKSLEWEGCPLQPVDWDSDDEFSDEDDYLQALQRRRVREARTDFSTKKLLKMLSQVSSGLEECILRTRYGDELKFDTLKMIPKEGCFNLPKFPILKKLVLDPINGFTQQVSQLSLENFPSLESLTLKVQSSEKQDVRHLDELLRDMDIDDLLSNTENLSWARVKELTINILCYQHNDRDALATLRLIGDLFPNLKKFNIKLHGTYVLSEDAEVSFRNWWKELANTFTHLEELVVRLSCSVTLSKVMDAIGRADFKELKTLRLLPQRRWNQSWQSDTEERYVHNFEKAFLAIPMIIFDGFQFNGNAVVDMMRFADHHKCNIYFK